MEAGALGGCIRGAGVAPYTEVCHTHQKRHNCTVTCTVPCCWLTACYKAEDTLCSETACLILAMLQSGGHTVFGNSMLQSRGHTVFGNRAPYYTDHPLLARVCRVTILTWRFLARVLIHGGAFLVAVQSTRHGVDVLLAAQCLHDTRARPSKEDGHLWREFKLPLISFVNDVDGIQAPPACGNDISTKTTSSNTVHNCTLIPNYPASHTSPVSYRAQHTPRHCRQ